MSGLWYKSGSELRPLASTMQEAVLQRAPSGSSDAGRFRRSSSSSFARPGSAEGVPRKRGRGQLVMAAMRGSKEIARASDREDKQGGCFQALRLFSFGSLPRTTSPVNSDPELSAVPPSQTVQAGAEAGSV